MKASLLGNGKSSALKKVVLPAVLAASVIALFSTSTRANGQGDGIGITVSYVNGTPTTITIIQLRHSL
jgi:hypothetical protein